MRWVEVKELARMFGILAVLVTAGMGLSAMAENTPGVVEVPAVPDVPAVETPAVTGPYVVAGPAASADPAPALPVAVPDGV